MDKYNIFGKKYCGLIDETKECYLVSGVIWKRLFGTLVDLYIVNQGE